MKFYETSDYIGREIARKEKELMELKQKHHEAQIREFFWFMQDQVSDGMNPEFLNATWTISIMGKSIELSNLAEVFGGIEQTLINYMDDDGICYSREEAEE